MPLLPEFREFIDVAVADRTPGVRQQARFNTLLATQNVETGELSLQIGVRVLQFDEQGQRLAGKGIEPWGVPLIGNNDCAVDPPTGQVRYLRTTETLQEWLDLLNSKPEPLMLQGDWFRQYMEAHITPLLRSFMEAANQPPFSKFA